VSKNNSFRASDAMLNKRVTMDMSARSSKIGSSMNLKLNSKFVSSPKHSNVKIENMKSPILN
jgi:hypothetical protein